MTMNHPSYVRTVLVTTDYSPTANRAITHAYRLVDEGGMVLICHVADAGSASLDPGVRKDLEEMLRGLVPSVPETARTTTRILVCEGKHAADTILQVAQSEDADLIVMASHGRTGISRALVGSVAESVVRHSTRPVLIVPMERAPA